MVSVEESYSQIDLLVACSGVTDGGKGGGAAVHINVS